MYEKAIYFKWKFIRNGIAGIVFSILLIYYIVTKNESVNPFTIVIPVVAFAWIFYGLRIAKKLKLKNKTSTGDSIIITDERISFKQIDFIFSICFFVVLLLSFNHWKYAGSFCILWLIAYTWWFSGQMKGLEEYFKS